jgi:oligoendopeptidase F
MPASLPRWDLSDLYPSPRSEKVGADMERARRKAASFKKSYEGRVTALSGEELHTAIRSYEALEELLGTLGSYAQLLYAEDKLNPLHAQFYQNTADAVTELSAGLVFFTLELNKLSRSALEARFKESKKLRAYQPWLRDLRVWKPYQLPTKMEELLHEKHSTGHAAWCRLFDETIAQMRFPFEGKKLTEAEIMNLLYSPQAATRKKAAKTLGKELKNHAPVFTLITNTLAKDKEIEDRWRGFARPISSRNLSNHVEDAVVEALMSAVQEDFPRLSHRYYRLKASWFGAKKLAYWDRNAPLPWQDEHHYSWDEAVSLVLDAYTAFSPEMARIGREFFDRGWIDARLAPGKDPGAFAHPTVPSVHPYLLVNFQGRTRDVMTLAHELGHGVHQVLSAGQGMLMADTPLTLAETASVFGEQLVFQEILRREKNARRKNALIAGKVEDMLNTVVRQVAFCLFEQRVHAARREQGELSTNEIGAIWLQVQSESLGGALRFAPEYSYYWTYIPHFIHSAFYVYAYAFGDCLVNALYARYMREREAGRGAEFERRYLDMLRAGGTLHHKELLAPFHIRIRRPEFWREGLDIISGYIDVLETAL